MTIAGEVRYDGVHCHLRIQQWTPEVIVLRISGSDVGEFGNAPMEELERRLAAAEPVGLFIDAREARGASIEVSGAWAQWLGANKARLQQVSLLAGRPFIRLTADFVRRFADLEDIMTVYSDAGAFDGVLARSLSGES